MRDHLALSSFFAALGVVLLGALPVAAQAPLSSISVVNDLTGGRALTSRGEGGFFGNPPQPVVGELGVGVAFVDINDDGLDDLLVGAPSLPPNNLFGPFTPGGHAYLIFGSTDRGAPGSEALLDFGLIDVGDGLDLIGALSNRVGCSVAAAGDVNGDSFPDIIIGASHRNGAGRTEAGGAYVVFGSPDIDTLGPGVSLEQMAATNRAVFLLGPRDGARAGMSVSGGVDVDGDGRDDVILGAPFDSTDGFNSNGTAMIVYGSAFSPTDEVVDLATLGAGEITELRGGASLQFLGQSVAGIGRFDPNLPVSGGTSSLGDDVAIGAPGTSLAGRLFNGAVYVVRGDVAGLPARYDVTDFGNAPDTAGVLYVGAASGDSAGSFVGPAGEFIDDPADFDDLIIVSPQSDALGKPNRGATYIVSGSFEGADPQGYDLAQIGQDSSLMALALYGQASGEGLRGVYAAPARDWNGDGVPDLLQGVPASALINAASQVLPEAGRVRVLNGMSMMLQAAASGGVVNLDFPGPDLYLAQFGGEAAGVHMGTGVAAGDFNDDGEPDLGMGAPQAASVGEPLDPTGIAFSRTGRVHVVYGPPFRRGALSGSEVYYSGPTVTFEVYNLAEPFSVFVDGIPAAVIDYDLTDPATIEFAVPPPLVFENAADLTVTSPLGTIDVADVLEYQPLVISTGPEPAKGLPGQTVDFTGEAFSVASDMLVTFGGVPAEILAVDPLAGTMTVVLPSGPPLNLDLDVEIDNSNGISALSSAFVYRTLMITSVIPDTGRQDVGIEDTSLAPAFTGIPPLTVTIELDGSIFPPEDLLVEWGNDEIGFTPLVVTLDEMTATFDVPFMLMGDTELALDVRVSDTTGNDVIEDAFTYLAGDFEEVPDVASPGFGVNPPRLLMSGDFEANEDILVQFREITNQTDLVYLFVGFSRAEPPIMIEGGQLAVDLSDFFFVVFITPMGNEFSFSQKMAPEFDPALDGVPVYLQAVTEERAGNQTRFGFTDLMIATIDSAP